MKNSFKKLFLVTLSLFSLSACGALESVGLKNRALRANEVEETHEHTWSAGYACDEKEHWHVSTCEHNLISEKEKHQFGSWKKILDPTPLKTGVERRRCQDCGYEETREIDKVFMFAIQDRIILKSQLTLAFTGKLVNDLKPINVGDELYFYCKNGEVTKFRVDVLLCNKVNTYTSLSYEETKDTGFGVEMVFNDESSLNAFADLYSRCSFMSDRDDLAIPSYDDDLGGKYYKDCTAYLDLHSRAAGGRATAVEASEDKPYRAQFYDTIAYNDVTFYIVCVEENKTTIAPGEQCRVRVTPMYSDTYSGSLYLYYGKAFEVREGGRTVGYLVITQSTFE